MPPPNQRSAMDRLEGSESALNRLQALMQSWTPEERAAQNKRLRERLQPIADQLRYALKAQAVWYDWLATTRQAETRDEKPR
ncbi:hypothetical protein [Acidocella sp.]|jgi:hypothetical protein|uniref:hypothetical protein n=1 Tax=Acidocella sp. TaxID=50710 RepID=UPI002639A990|nr:hypothetical protein [Acidocella sp.]MDD2794668.1 hypothetical protein [Acidocella sp.]